MTVATLAGVSNLLLLAFARQYISDDLAGLVISVYAYVSVPLCAYGLVGIITVGREMNKDLMSSILLTDCRKSRSL